jgi:hypothetical protein
VSVMDRFDNLAAFVFHERDLVIRVFPEEFRL